MTLEYIKKLFEKDKIEPYDVLLYKNNGFCYCSFLGQVGRQPVEAIFALQNFHL